METSAVIFDMDGTLTRPWFDFKKIRAEIGIAEPVLETLEKMPEGPERRRGYEILYRYEREGVEKSELNYGAREILAHLAARGLPTALLTRNTHASVDAILSRHGIRFDVVVTREDAPVKPAPDGILLIVRRLDVPPSRTLMVGDFKYDIMAGQAAGTRTCLITNGEEPKFEVASDHVIARLEELRDLIP